MGDILKWVVLGGIFILPFIPLYVADGMFFPFITGKNFTFRIIVEIIFASWVLLALYDPAYRPRFSWVLGSFSAFLVVIFFADLLGEHPQKSFWSNFERMEGFVTLAHLFLYFVVVGSVMTTKKVWYYFFNTTLVAAFFMVLFVFQQLAGSEIINQGGWRVDGTLGNATYLAVYMLFHVFIALLQLVHAKQRWLQVVYAGLAALFAIILVLTATRGAMLGLAGGLLLTTLYIAIFERENPLLRKIAIGGLVALMVMGAVFYAVKDTQVVQNNPYMSRMANISLEAGETRFTIWGMALEGVKERPILGWGQGNFNYVFNKEYEPSLYNQEQWFDRVHNIFFDWAIAGGLLGVLTYLALYFGSVYYASVRDLFRKREEHEDRPFSVTESAILLGLLAGYFFHNLFVFDNIVSYLLFATMIAFIHSRVGREIPVLGRSIDRNVVTQVAAPLVLVALVASVYFINVPHMLASKDLIRGLSLASAARENQQISEEQRTDVYFRALDSFEQALGRNSFADHEIREQIVRIAQIVNRSTNASTEVKQRYRVFAEEEIREQIEEKPNDARVRVFASSYYRMMGNTEEALTHLQAARELSPRKQQILFEHGLAYLQSGDHENAFETFKYAFELEPRNAEARMFYAATAIYTDRMELIDELITDEHRVAYAQNDFISQALYETEHYAELGEVYEIRIADAPDNMQHRVSLAVVKHELGDTEAAVQVLEEAIEYNPDFEAQGRRFIEQLRSGDI